MEDSKGVRSQKREEIREVQEFWNTKREVHGETSGVNHRHLLVRGKGLQGREHRSEKKKKRVLRISKFYGFLGLRGGGVGGVGGKSGYS